MQLHRIEGLVIAGTAPRCGKTVLTAGLTAAMVQGGFKVQALKPLEFQPQQSILRGREQAFLEKITASLQRVDPVSVPSPHEMSMLQWNRVLELCRQMAYPALIESPGSVAAPLKLTDGVLFDAVDLAKALGLPMLLVTPRGPDVIAQVAPAITYLRERGAHLAGWVSVETLPMVQAPFWDQEVLYLAQQYQLHYLGNLPYSPSISVEGLQQGNLIRLTESEIDLLPIQQAMELLV